MVNAISTSTVNAIKGTEFEGMSIQMMAAMIMLEVGGTKKQEAENKIAEMKAQNDKAKAINSMLDRMTQEMSKYDKEDSSHQWTRGEILANYSNEAKSLGIDTSSWKASISSSGKKDYVRTSADQWKAISSQLQHLAENCNSDNQTQMVKLQDFMGQYNSFVSGASDSIKQANQILQGLAKS